MTYGTRKIILAALRNHRGDDYERALAAWRNLTPTQMGQEYGESGQTRQEILDTYRNHVKNVERAINEVERIPETFHYDQGRT